MNSLSKKLAKKWPFFLIIFIFNCSLSTPSLADNKNFTIKDVVQPMCHGIKINAELNDEKCQAAMANCELVIGDILIENLGLYDFYTIYKFPLDDSGHYHAESEDYTKIVQEKFIEQHLTGKKFQAGSPTITLVSESFEPKFELVSGIIKDDCPFNSKIALGPKGNLIDKGKLHPTTPGGNNNEENDSPPDANNPDGPSEGFKAPGENNSIESANLEQGELGALANQGDGGGCSLSPTPLASGDMRFSLIIFLGILSSLCFVRRLYS